MNRLWIALATLAFSTSALGGAADSRSRFSGQIGVGTASSTSADGKSNTSEGPLGYGFMLDYALKTQYFLFGEHMRSFGEGASSIGLSGLGIKYYPWLSPLDAQGMYADFAGKSLLGVTGNCYYFAAVSGLSQASVPSAGKIPATVAVAPYIGLKSGYESSLSRDWSLKAELTIAFSVGGSGTVQYTNLAFGMAYTL